MNDKTISNLPIACLLGLAQRMAKEYLCQSPENIESVDDILEVSDNRQLPYYFGGVMRSESPTTPDVSAAASPALSKPSTGSTNEAQLQTPATASTSDKAQGPLGSSYRHLPALRLSFRHRSTDSSGSAGSDKHPLDPMEKLMMLKTLVCERCAGYWSAISR